MKTWLVFFLSFLLITTTTIANCQAQEGRLVGVKVEHAGFTIESFDDVDCNSFYAVFKKSIKVDSLFKPNCLFALRKLNKLFTKKHRIMDVRGTITFIYLESEVKYCFDPYGYFQKDGITYSNKKLIKFLDRELNLWKR